MTEKKKIQLVVFILVYLRINCQLNMTLEGTPFFAFAQVPKTKKDSRAVHP
jgi:hypothetical protein